VSLYSDPAHWMRAARYYEAAALARVEGDPQRVRNRVLAGRIYVGVGKLSRARGNLTRAAEESALTGDVYQAAQLYLDAALVAHGQRQFQAALQCVQRAERLASSPHLASADAAAIRQRLSRTRLPQLVTH
jgi:tetratricopeptide (TPR) repeat protein